MPASAFKSAFERWSRRVRARLATRRVLTGAAIGFIAGAAAAGVAWKERHGALRPASVALGVAGAAVGLAIARKKRWDDEEVALYLDAKLDSNEAIATAVEIERKGSADEAGAVVLTQAAGALESATSKRIGARVLRPAHFALPLAAGAIAYLSLIPLPPPPVNPNASPGGDKVKLADVSGLDKIIKLAETTPRDEAQRERLRQMAEEAKRIREKLREGVEKREALSDIAKLQDQITQERLSFGDGEQRKGLEAAMGKLGGDSDLKKAEKALGDRDLVELDDEMRKLANRLEDKDREKALKALEEAAEAARKQGAKDVAKALEDEKKRMEERGEKNDVLRELAKELGQDGQKALEDFDKSTEKDIDKLQKKLAEAMKKLTPEQRKKLAENLKKRMGDGDGPSKKFSKKKLKEMLDKLDTPEGEQQLEKELEDMAQDPPDSDESERQKQLDDAEEGAEETEGMLGGMPLPMQSNNGGNKSGNKSGSGQDNGGDPSSGHSDDPPGKADHHGQTGKVEGGDLKSHANAKINKANAMPGITMGRTSAHAGETANMAGTGALGNAAAEELGGVEHSQVPEEYREQVGRYFQPR